MILSHFSYNPLRFDPRLTYAMDAWNKPVGLWLSDESQRQSWSAWCRAEEYATAGLRYRTDFSCDTEKWSVLDDEDKVVAFGETFTDPMNPEGLKIDWPRVAGRYSGIIISPYQWNMRLHTRARWYYGWDCASACVWDLSTIKQITPSTQLELAGEES